MKMAFYAISPRFGSALCVKQNLLYLFGGMVEDGDKQYTLNDFYTLGKFNEHP